jgi:hypothetical protein
MSEIFKFWRKKTENVYFNIQKGLLFNNIEKFINELQIFSICKLQEFSRNRCHQKDETPSSYFRRGHSFISCQD